MTRPGRTASMTSLLVLPQVSDEAPAHGRRRTQ
jgi:hypothetical protein